MKHRITIEVDSSECFDALHKVGADEGLAMIGSRLSMPLLTGQMPAFSDHVGLTLYGVSVTGVEAIEPAGDA